MTEELIGVHPEGAIRGRPLSRSGGIGIIVKQILVFRINEFNEKKIYSKVGNMVGYPVGLGGVKMMIPNENSLIRLYTSLNVILNFRKVCCH